MKNLYSFILFTLLALTTMLGSCSDDIVDIDSVNKQTILVYMPWSGSATSQGLYPYLKNNLDSIERAIVADKGTRNSRILVFLSRTMDESYLYELTYNSSTKSVDYNVIDTYEGHDYATANGITNILNKVSDKAEALNYALIIGGHGCGWTHKSDWNNYPNDAKPWRHTTSTPERNSLWPFIENATGPQTRFFGSVSDISNLGIDIETLVNGIKGSNIQKLQYILFDNCMMCNVETAYAIREVANYMIASPNEILAQGVPYYTIWNSLCSSTPNYSNIVSGYYNFYANFQYPWGSFSAIDCRQMDNLAAIMKTINSRYSIDDTRLDGVQKMDGFNETIFYDLGNYVDSLHLTNSLKAEFDAQLKLTVKSTKSTEEYLSALYGKAVTYEVKDFSGITISDPSKNAVALRGKENTAWWKATHEE